MAMSSADALKGTPAKEVAPKSASNYNTGRGLAGFLHEICKDLIASVNASISMLSTSLGPLSLS
jgi:hypothetical protein